MNQYKNGKEVLSASEHKKHTWYRIAGAAALLTIGYILYRKKQKGIGTALMTGSIKVLTGAIPEV